MEKEMIKYLRLVQSKQDSDPADPLFPKEMSKLSEAQLDELKLSCPEED